MTYNSCATYSENNTTCITDGASYVRRIFSFNLYPTDEPSVIHILSQWKLYTNSVLSKLCTQYDSNPLPAPVGKGFVFIQGKKIAFVYIFG